MESIITVVGFLGAGKTTIMKYLVDHYLSCDWKPFVILNDYENATLDAQYFHDKLDSKLVKALNGSCICCSGIGELRDFVNNIPARENGITLIEANGTSDACSLAGFLGVGIEDRFLPPIQISVVDVKNWQKRGVNNELEANQVQVSSLIVLTHTDKVSLERKKQVEQEVQRFNKLAKIIEFRDLNVSLLEGLSPSTNTPNKLDHKKAHWSSCSVDLPSLPDLKSIKKICNDIPTSILRIKGCVQLMDDEHFTYFERTPDGDVYVRLYNGIPVTGPKLISIGPGSDKDILNNAIEKVLVA